MTVLITESLKKHGINDHMEAFKQAMINAGMPSVPDSIEITGAKIPRWKDPQGESGNKDCWYRFGINPDGSGFGKFSNHKGIKDKWHSSYEKRLSKIQFNQKEKEQLAVLNTEAEKAESALKKGKRKKACTLFEKGQLVTALKKLHWYIKEKQISAFEDLKQERSTLLIPCYSGNNELLAVQRIYRDNTGKTQKRFLGSYSGGFFTIGQIKPDGLCYLTEGYATGATVHEATGAPVIVVFSCRNLIFVAEIIRKKYPNTKIINVADNDLKKAKQDNKKNSGLNMAKELLRKLNIPYALSPMDSDFNDYFVQVLQETNDEKLAYTKVRKALENIQTPEAEKIELEDWPDIVPFWFDDNNIKQFQLIDDSLPNCLVDFCNAVAKNTETPIELSLSMMLAILSASLHRKFEIQINPKDPGYIEALCLWCLCLLESGNRKSATLGYMQAPLKAWITQKQESLRHEITISNKKRELQESRIKALESEYKKPNKSAEKLQELEQNILQLNNELIAIRKEPKFITQDVTTEKLGKLLADNNGCMSLLSAEGGIFDTIAGRYSKTGVINIDVYNQAYSGEMIIKDRANDQESFQIDKVALTIGIAPQPSVLQNLKNKTDFITRGFFPRALIMQPNSLLGDRPNINTPIPSDLITKYNNLIVRLCNINMPDKPMLLKGSQGAFNEFISFIKKREPYLKTEDNEGLKAWTSKLQGQLVRIAAIFHCIDNFSDPAAKEINEKQIERAIALAEDLFIPHAKKVFGGFQDSTKTRNIKKIITKLKEIKSFDKATFSTRFYYLFKKAQERDEILELLVKENIIKNTQVKITRKPKSLYFVNPKLHKTFKE